MTKTTPKIQIAMALRNDRLANVRIGPNGKPSATIPGQIRLAAETEADLLRDDCIEVFPLVEPGGQVETTAVLNLGGDYDAFSESHYSLSERFTADTPIFNNPRGIAITRKEFLAERLGGIDGLKVPRVTRFQALAPQSFQDAFESAGLAYPVTVQPTTTPDNREIVIIRNAKDWPEALRLDWPRKWFYLTELDGAPTVQHMRIKVCFAGSAVQIAQFPFAYPPRQVAANVANKAQVDKARLTPVLKSMLAKVPLDFWTVELAILPSGEFRLEHLWVGLPMRDDMPPKDAVRGLWTKISPKLDELVRNPSLWRHSLEKAARAAQTRH